jgi:hypothetical protein
MLLSINGGYTPTCYVRERSSRKGSDMRLVPNLRETFSSLVPDSGAPKPLWYALVAFGVIGYPGGGRKWPLSH